MDERSVGAMNVAKAFEYARGAVWHLEVAVPQLEAAERGLTHAPELAAAARGHIARATADAQAARRLQGTAAGAGADQLVHALVGLDRVGAVDMVSATRAARVQAHAGALKLAASLETPARMLGRVPVEDAPASELALVDDLATARSMHRVSDVQAATVQHVLERGTIHPEPVRWVGGYGNGNGAMPIVRVAHPEAPMLELHAVHRPILAQAAQEAFFARLAKHASVEHLVAPVGLRSDGSALVLLAPGHPLWDEGVDGADDIERVISQWYRSRFPKLSQDDVRLAGRLDREAVQSLDYLVAQADNNAGGALADARAGHFTIFDRGMLGRGETRDPLKPGMKSHFLGATPGHVELHPATAERMRSMLTDARLADAHAALHRDAGDLPKGHATALAQDRSPEFLARMRMRRDQLATGGYEYEPMDLNANPLAHMDWLNGGRHPY